jgi:membrane protein DedA with SNARE-associated domain
MAILAAAQQHLPGVLQDLEPTLNHYGYLAILCQVLVEDIGAPVPGETVLILGAVYAGSGRLDIALVVLVAACGALIGDNIGFAIGRFGGRRLAERYGRFVFLTPERLDKATGFFERHGGKVVVIARFVEGLRQANGIIAGTTRMPWARFVFFNAIGAVLWVAVWSSVGYFSGSHIETIYNDATRWGMYLAILVAGLLIPLIVRRVVRSGSHQERRGDPTSR